MECLLREQDYFFVDKTNLIKEWWENGDAIIIEFKVYEPDEEKTLQDAVQSALKQIAEKNYDAEIIHKCYENTLADEKKLDDNISQDIQWKENKR